MWNLLKKINSNLIWLIPLTLALGFAYGLVAETKPLKQAIIPLTVFMVFPMMVSLKIKQVFQGGDFKAQLMAQLINFGVIPFLAFGLGRLFFPEKPYLALGLLLIGLLPTSGMTISWTGMAKGNLAAAVKMTVMGLVLGSLATPVYVQALMGAEVSLNLAAIFKQIGLIIFLPMAAGFLTQQALVKKYGLPDFQKRLAPRFPALSSLGLLAIVFIAMALKARAIAASPQMLLYILIPLILLYGLNYLISTVFGRTLLPHKDGVAMIYGTVMRNLSVALAVAMAAFGPAGSEAALVVALAFVVQVQSASWYVRLSGRLFPALHAAPAAVAVPVPAMERNRAS